MEKVDFILYVSTIDKEPPYYTNCPQDFEEKFQPNMPITWTEEIIFKDNSGEDPKIITSISGGSKQLVPGKVTVSCIIIENYK